MESDKLQDCDLLALQCVHVTSAGRESQLDQTGLLDVDWWNESPPDLPVKRPELNGFTDVIGSDVLRVDQVGDGAGDFEDAIVGADAQTGFRRGHLQKFLVASFSVQNNFSSLGR